MENNNNFFLLELHGANPNSKTSKAKISLNKIDHIDKHKWYLGINGYPYAYINGSRVQLHRYIWWLNTGIWTNTIINSDNTTTKLYIDHINRDKLDARDENLRASTPAENSYNKTSKNDIIDPISLKPLHHIKLTKSGYCIKITKNGKTNKINKISNLEEAKEIYNMMATELFNEYAVLYN